MAPGKFADPDRTAEGEARALVPLVRLDTLWINTGTLCNITCVNCYIDSSPTNDQLAWFSLDDAIDVMEEATELALGTREIGFTGGEPFANPQMTTMAEAALERGFEVLILTNAMRPMQRPRVQEALLDLRQRFGERLVLRVSLDHYTAGLHEAERGRGTWDQTLAGIDWLSGHGFHVALAGRTCWGEPEASERDGYARLIQERGWAVDATDPLQLVLFPEMDERVDVPEITTGCWKILDKSPGEVMCAQSRMVVKRKGASGYTVLPCTLLPYDDTFEMGENLADSLRADGGNFSKGAVKLNHPHCAKFCVLGGGSCSR